MNIKKILFGVSFLVFGGCLIGAFGLYLMEIENHYGDFQELYYESKSGDLIVDFKRSKFGVLTKDWRRISVSSSDGTSVDLFNWVYGETFDSEVTIYKTNDKSIDCSEVTFMQVEDMIEISELIYVTSN